MTAKIRKLILAGFVLAVASFAAAEHVVITRGDLPPVVWEAFNKTFPHADTAGMKITYITEDTLRMYRLVSTRHGQEVDAVYLPSGRVLQAREVVVIDTLPEPARVVVVERYPRSQVSFVERLLPPDGKTFYRLYLVTDDRRDTIMVAPDGTIIQVK